jgi:hypothetical protein
MISGRSLIFDALEERTMQRKFSIWLSIIFLAAAGFACGESAPVVMTASGNKTSLETEEAPAGSVRGNPAPFGSRVTVGDLTLSIDDFSRPADEIVEAGNPFNYKPETGEEYVMILLNAVCEKNKDETCRLGPYAEIALLGSAGIAHEAEWFLSGIDGQLDPTEFYGGATVSGRLFFLVGKEETDLVLRYRGFLGVHEAFLAVQP